MTPHDDSIHELIGRVRRRFLFNVALSQSVLAGSVAMAGAILILLFGDQFLDWRWLALAAVVTFPLAYWRTSRRVPARYRVAQIVDDRLELRDSLSTALYFSEAAPDGRSSEDMRRAQRVASERLVGQVDPKIAVPLVAPRMLYVFGSLFLVAATLFGVRYGIQRRMDLARPLTSVLMDAFGNSSFAKRAGLTKNKKSSIDIWGQTQVDSMSGAETQYKDGQDMKGQEFLDSAPDGVLNTVDVPEVDKGIADQKSDSKNPSDSSKGGQGEAQSEEQDQTADAAKGPSSPKGGDPSAGSKPGDASSKQQGNNAGDSSLASKVKDALSNLMAAMRQKSPQNGQSGSQENGGDAKAQQQKAGQKGQGQGQKSNSDQQSADMGQPGEEGEGGKSADLKGGNQGDGPNGPDSGSGAGKQDGDKAAKLAEQVAAMGKISEIIGKRSANVSGEVTIEVTSSKQPLKTPYSDGRAAHSEAGAEINRDEVPAAFQEYVQQYFEQVRKPAKAAGKPVAGQTPTGAPQAPTASGPPQAR